MKAPVAVVLALVVVVAGAVTGRFLSRRALSEPSAPALTPPAAPVFNERLDGRRYDNRDLGLHFSAPEGWSGMLGDRSPDRPPYEGLVVRMAPKESSEPGSIQPFVTVVKRAVPAGGSRDPLAYIAREVLTPEKSVVEAPAVVTLSGRQVGRVTFDLRSGTMSLRVLQVVHLANDEAIILSATAPSGSFADWREKFENVFRSMKLGS